MNSASLKIPDTFTTKGYYVVRIELRVNFEGNIVLSGIIRSNKPHDDHYISWDCDGKNPTIKTFGNLIL